MAKEKDIDNIPDGVDQPDLYRIALTVLQGATEEEPQTTSTVVESIEDEFDGDLPGYKIYNSLLGFTRVPGTRIGSRKGRNGGYFLLPVSADNSDEFLSIADQKKEKTLEKHLWPVVSDWLKLVKQIERSSSQVANLKSGGIWSNPDVVGLNILEDLGFFDVEITTVEVKPTLNGWKYYFFEAVSHKRFAERVYFIYRDDGDFNAEQRLEILRYAEKYGVGVVEIQLPDGEFEKIQNWQKMTDQERVGVLDLFVEIMPAPFEAISARDKIDFLRQLGVASKADLYSFGSVAG